MEINILSPSLFQLDSKFLLVIAHPDDEVLFFSPFIIACKNHNNPIAILCISDGNYYGQGPKRRKEIIESAVALGLEPSDVTVLQDLNLLDCHQNYWSPQLLSYYINEKIEQFKPTSIITFDEYGVSGHPNHISVFHGVEYTCSLLQSTAVCSDSSKPIKVYKLESTSLFRKFCGIFDIFTSLFCSEKVMINFNFWIVFSAMYAHSSQLVWYRILFILFSRYSYINTLVEIPLSNSLTT